MHWFKIFRKDVRLPVQLQRAMAAEAEAAREARAKVIFPRNKVGIKHNLNRYLRIKDENCYLVHCCTTMTEGEMRI